MEQVGIIKSISKKPDGKRVAFCLEGNMQWYNGYLSDFVGFGKGDNVSFEVTVNGTFFNFGKLTLVASAGAQSMGGEIAPVVFTDSEKVEPSQNLLSERDRMIMAQTFTKCYYYGNKASSIEEVHATFDSFYKRL